jgi:hypothetical protein
MGRDETHDAACKWAFRKTFRRSPTPDELRDYKLALDERDRMGAWDALPIYARLRGNAAKAPRAERQRKDRRGQNGHADSAPVCIEDRPLSPKRRGRPPRVRQAQALLQEQLADGPKPGVLVEAAAEKADIAKAELIGATDALGVRCRRGQWWLPGRRL